MILAIINRLRPMPVFGLHVITLLPFIMFDVVVMMIIMMILGKHRRA